MWPTVLTVLCCFIFANISFARAGPLAVLPSREDSPKFGQFVADCIRSWQLKYPKILVGSEDSRVELPTAFSQSHVRVGVRVRFSEEDFRKIVTRDHAPNQIVVVGNRTVVSTVLRLTFEANVLIRKGILILLCTNCDRNMELIQGRDFLGDLILGSPVDNLPMNVRLHGVIYDYRVRKLTSFAIGHWNASGVHILESWMNRKFCFQDAVIKVLTVKTLPYLEFYNDSTGLSTPKDFTGAMLQLLSEKLNFRFQVNSSVVTSYGEMGRNGKFSGVIGHFIEQQFDLGLGVFSRTPDRQKVVDFTAPFASGKMSFISMFPTKMSRRAWTIAIRSFDWKVWSFTILFCILTALAIRFSLFLGHPRSGQAGDWTTTLMSSWLLQGNEERPKANSAKIVIFITCTFSWTVYCFYNGVLISYLTLDTSVIITTLAELTDSKYTIMFANGSSSSEMLKTSRIPSLRAMYNSATVLETAEDGLRFLCKSESLAILSGNALFYSLAKNKVQCRYYFMKEPLYKDDYHFITQKNSVLNSRLSKAITKIRESGILSHLENFYQLRKPAETRLKDRRESIYFQHLIGPFSLLIGGVVLSLVAFFLETLYHFVSKTRRM